MLTMIRSFLRDERGATAIEYALIAAVLGALIVTALTTLGGDLAETFTNIGTKLKADSSM